LNSASQLCHRHIQIVPTKKLSPAKTLRPRLRVQSGEDIALGPGKVDLLALIGKTGSIRDAAERMNMSYMRAWTLIRTMNRCFKEPVVEAIRGGKTGGGARLTETGKQALELYQHMEKSCLGALSDDWRKVKKLLRA
jgi:molybdate transport system regulatory protein